jgi:hypothetical protein
MAFKYYIKQGTYIGYGEGESEKYLESGKGGFSV